MWADILLLLGASILLVGGLIGSILPVLPGPPLSWGGVLLYYLLSKVDFDWKVVILTAIIAAVVYVLDYFIPAMGTKKFGGSKAGAWGTTIGLLVGIFLFPPIGILVGPFLGALVGELAFNKSPQKTAFKAALGSFIGFLASTFLKLVVAVAYMVFVVQQVWTNWRLIF